MGNPTWNYTLADEICRVEVAVRMFAVVAMCLMGLGCTTGLGDRTNQRESAAYCFDTQRRAAVRVTDRDCASSEQRITESQFAAFVGSRVLPTQSSDLPDQQAVYCFQDLHAAYRKVNGSCRYYEIQISESEYAAYVGSGEFPESIKFPSEREGFVHCLDPGSGMVYSGQIYKCSPGDVIIDRTEYLERLKKQTYL